MSVKTTDTVDDLDLSIPAFKEACGQLMVLGRKLAPRMRAGDVSAAGELGAEGGRLMALAGATPEEGIHYIQRIMVMVLAEAQA